MPKKRKLSKQKKQDSSEEQSNPDKSNLQPRTEIQYLIHALEANDTVPKLPSEEELSNEDQNIVVSPSFIKGETPPTVETKLLPEPKHKSARKENKEYNSTGNIFGDVGVFLTELTDSYAKRYDSWEESTNSILAVLRKLEAITLDNSQQLISTIGRLEAQINEGLEKFKVKRDYVEMYSESNHTEVAQMLKKTLDLLRLQIKEFRVKNLLNQLITIYAK
jgi:hypothetical protein